MKMWARTLGVAAVAAACVAATLAILVPARADGPVPREFEGRIEHIDAAAGTITLVREHGGRKTRLTLATKQAPVVFDCDSLPTERSFVTKGLNVSVFYESAGSRDIASLVIVERSGND